MTSITPSCEARKTGSGLAQQIHKPLDTATNDIVLSRAQLRCTGVGSEQLRHLPSGFLSG